MALQHNYTPRQPAPVGYTTWGARALLPLKYIRVSVFELFEGVSTYIAGN